MTRLTGKERADFERFWTLLTMPSEVMSGLVETRQIQDHPEAPYGDQLEDRRLAHRANGERLFPELREHIDDPVSVALQVVASGVHYLLSTGSVGRVMGKMLKHQSDALYRLKMDLLRRDPGHFLRAKFVQETEAVMAVMARAEGALKQPAHAPTQDARNRLIRDRMRYFTAEAPKPMRKRTAARLIAKLFFYAGLDVFEISSDAILKTYKRHP